MDDMILPKWVLERWLPRTPCAGCGQIERPVLLYLPRIVIGPVHDALLLHGECVGCRTPLSAQVRLPRLELAYLLLFAWENKLRIMPRRCDRFVVVNAGTDKDLSTMRVGYLQLLQQTVAAEQVQAPVDEWKRLCSNPDAMNDFLRRLGILGEDPPPF